MSPSAGVTDTDLISKEFFGTRFYCCYDWRRLRPSCL